jgi:hypothetical protein
MRPAEGDEVHERSISVKETAVATRLPGGEGTAVLTEIMFEGEESVPALIEHTSK